MWSSCDICATLWLAKWSDAILHAHILSHQAPVKAPKSKYNLQCLNLKLTAEGILGYFSNKSTFDDKLKVSCPADLDNYLICMHCFETNTCALLDTI